LNNYWKEGHEKGIRRISPDGAIGSAGNYPDAWGVTGSIENCYRAQFPV
jgi:hypothetical protein